MVGKTLNAERKTQNAERKTPARPLLQRKWEER